MLKKQQLIVKTLDHRFEKLADRINDFINDLRMNNTLEVQGKINQFYYMQKMAELETLKESLDETLKRAKFFQDTFEARYNELAASWSRDARWLNQHINSLQKQS